MGSQSIDLLKTPKTPYKDLMPYSEEDAQLFFGREKDWKNIVSNLKGSPLTVLYGSSGVGKSSVLRAGVAYHLRQEAKQNLNDYGTPEFAVVVFNSWQNNSLNGLVQEIKKDVQTIFPEQEIAKLESASDLDREIVIFSSFLLAKKELYRLISPLISRLISLLFIEFLTTAAELLGNEEVNGILFVILDQFEEYFLYHQDEDREGTFAVEFPLAVNCPDLPVNFLISIREDSLAKLDHFKARIPCLFDNYLRIRHLNTKSAYEAIVKPIKKYNELFPSEQPISVQEDLAEVVIDQVSQLVTQGNGRGGLEKLIPQLSKQIETPYLQLVMTRLWREEMKAGSPCLRLETFLKLGGAKQIVRDHLNREMKSLSEDERKAAANVFQYLVTPSGNKIAYPVLDLVELTGLKEKQLKDLLVQLSEGSHRILRPVGTLPSQPNVERYEIFHDVLAQPILSWRESYLATKHLEQEREEAKQLGIRLIKQGLAVQSLRQQRRRQDELAALLALQAYHFNQQDRLDVLYQVDDALRQALSARYFSNILKHDSVAFSSIAFSSDGTKLAAGSWNGNIYLWNQEQSYSEFKPLAGHKEGINAIAFSPDGQWLASGSRDKTVRLWDLREKQPVSKIIGNHENDVTSIAFSPDSSLLASGSKDQTVKIWNWHQLDHIPIVLEEHSSKGHMGRVRSLSFSSDSSKLAVGCDDRSIWLWDVQEPDKTPDKEPLVRYFHEKKIRSVAFSPDKQLLVSASDDYTIQLWDITQPQERPKILEDRTHKTKGQVRDLRFIKIPALQPAN